MSLDAHLGRLAHPDFAEDEEYQKWIRKLKKAVLKGIEAQTGRKVPLGFVQTATENEKACAAFLRELQDRGLQANRGLLFVIDGSKGLRKAVQTVFGDKALVQRCQWHKRENVVSYLPKTQQGAWRKRLQGAYARPTYA